MIDRFEPRNELERRLLDAQEGRLAGEDFIQELLGAQVFVPVEEPLGVDGIQSSPNAKPLLIQSEEGEQILAVFTSPERAKPLVSDMPDYQGGILVEFRWVIERVGAGCTVALNPGWPVGIELEPDLIEALGGGTEV